MESVANLPTAMAFVDRAMELDASYFYGACHLLKGRFEGERPVELGGNPKKARESLVKAMEINEGRFLLARVYMARYFAVPTQDSTLFESELEAVLEASDDILPDARLLTALAKLRAEELLFSMEDFFVELPGGDGD